MGWGGGGMVGELFHSILDNVCRVLCHRHALTSGRWCGNRTLLVW